MSKIRENFYLPSRELRATTDANGSRTISGTIAYNSPSVGLPWVESVAPGAFSGALKPNADVLLLRDHKQESLLGRTLSKTLVLEDNSKGLSFRATLPNTGYASDTLESISRGDLSGVSFGFGVHGPDGDVWANDGSGNVTRTLHKVDLAEISVTSFPAFPESSVSLRSVPKEYRSLIRSYADDLEDDCDCECESCSAGDCEDCSNSDCQDDPDCCAGIEERSAWKHRAEMSLELAQRRR